MVLILYEDTTSLDRSIFRTENEIKEDQMLSLIKTNKSNKITQ